MPWPHREAVDAALADIKSRSRTLNALVFGQGICLEDRPYFPDFQKRLDVAARIEEGGHTARLPETEVAPPSPGDRDFLKREVQLAKSYDICVALQPMNTVAGAPTLKLELADLAADPDTRTKVWLFRPDSYGYDAFEAVASRFVDSQVFAYRADIYQQCEEVRDMLDHVLDVAGLPTI